MLDKRRTDTYIGGTCKQQAKSMIQLYIPKLSYCGFRLSISMLDKRGTDSYRPIGGTCKQQANSMIRLYIPKLSILRTTVNSD